MSTSAPRSILRPLALLLTLLLAIAGLALPAPGAQAEPGGASASALAWGFKSSWRGYVSGFGGTAETAGGAGSSPAYTWPAAAAAFDPAAGQGSADFGGSVHWTVPAHGIDITMSAPRLVLAGDGTGSLYWTIGGDPEILGATLSGVVIGSPTAAEGRDHYSVTAAVTMTAEGGAAFGGSYGAGTALDALSFTISVPSAPAPTATTLTASPEGEAAAGDEVVLTATVTPAATGSVQFRDGATALGEPVAVDAGTATLTVSTLTEGNHELGAEFTSSDTAYASSTSTALAYVVTTRGDGGGADPAPTLTVSKTSGLDASGETVTVTGSGYDPAQPMYLILCRDVPLEDVTFAFAMGCTSGSKQITPNPTTATMVKLEADGSFTTTFAVAANAAYPEGVAVYTLANHTAMNDRTQDAKQAISFTPLLTVTPASGLDPAGQTVTVTGSGYDPDQPMYLIYCRDVPVATVTFSFAMGCTSGSKQVTPNPTTATMVKLESDGTFSTTLTIAANASFASGGAIFTLANHTAMDDRSQDARRAVAFAGATSTATTIDVPARSDLGSAITVRVAVTPVAAGTVELSGAGEPQTATLDPDGAATFTLSGLAAGSYDLSAVFAPANPLVHAGSTAAAAIEVVASVPTRAGVLSWGVKSAFRAYVTGPIAQGSISTSGATASGAAFDFPQIGGALDSAGLGSVAFGGTVRFTGHAGALDVRFSDPTVRIDSASAATLLLRVDSGSPVAFATLDLAAGSRSDGGGTVSYRDVPATLTSSGATAFAGFYAAGAPLDAVTFTVGAAGSASGGTRTVAAYVSDAPAPAATPPATTGLESPQSRFTAGESVTFTASGFQPNETGILVVVYSTPTVLATDATADAAGVVTWTGELPAGLTGEHTVTFQGSVDRGIVIRIAPADVVGCTVDGAELSWGFKESFRAYLDGSIADGEWTTADGATYATPRFSWAAGAGGYDGATGDADLAFSGSVRFTGHGGALDTTIANPRVVIDGDRAVLLLDVTGTTQSGEAVAQTGVEFADLDLAAAEPGGGGDLVAVSAIPATLTAAGAAAFGTYPAGETLDPVDLRITVDPACAVATVDDAPPLPATETMSDRVPGWPWVAAAIALLVLIVTVAVLLVRRARSAG